MNRPVPGPARSTDRRSGRSNRPRHADRIGAQPWLIVGLAVAAAVAAAAGGGMFVGRRGGDPFVGQGVGVVVALLGVLGLPSISVRLVARLVLVASGALVVRFGVLNGSLVSGQQTILAWVVAAAAILVLADRVATDAQPTLAAGPGGPGGMGQSARPVQGGAAEGPGRLGRADPARTARSTLGVVAAVVVLAVLLTPVVLPHVAQSSAVGDGPSLDRSQDGQAALRSSDRLDMTRRPDLTDEIVFTVDSNRRTFWRGETFDRWDGRTWTRSQPRQYLLAGDGAVTAGADDLAVSGADEFTQRFRIEASYADVVYAAPSATSIEARRPLAQRLDGTLGTASAPLGRGATYTVTSRRALLSEDVLRAADAGTVPADVLARYADPPTATDRVLAAATEVTADASTTYDKILALEAWMGGRTEYSLDAPLSPEGVDVVDHFLFDSRQGWCEQVASSLVVLARANGIPARLVTGFVPDERDPVTGTYVVRARDAHAWTEVWFPELGWVPFDPTADVPLAGADQADSTLGQWLADHAVVIVLVAVGLGLIGWSVARIVRRARRRRASRPSGWPALVDRSLEALGARVDRPRGRDETAAAYAAALAVRYGDDRLLEVGRVLDDLLYAEVPPSPADQDRAGAVLAELAERAVPEAEPVAGPEPEPVSAQ